MSDVLIPGARDVRGTLDGPGSETESSGAADAIVVACPPHPQQGGSRSDPRLVAVSDALRGAGIDCLRFDYGAWDEGYGERADVRNAVRWARERYDRVGVFGYSFGASLAVLAAAADDSEAATVEGVVALAPTARLADVAGRSPAARGIERSLADLDVVAALEGVDAPVAVLYGERDSTVDWEPVVERARERDDRVVSLPADHFFLGTRDEIASESRAFFERTLLES